MTSTMFGKQLQISGAICFVGMLQLEHYVAAALLHSLTHPFVCTALASEACAYIIVATYSWLRHIRGFAANTACVGAEAKDDFFWRPTHQEEDVMHCGCDSHGVHLNMTGGVLLACGYLLGHAVSRAVCPGTRC